MSKTINEVFTEHGLTLYTDSKLTKQFFWFEKHHLFDEFVDLVSKVNKYNLHKPSFRLALKKQVSTALFYWNYVIISDAEKWKEAFAISPYQVPYSNQLLHALGVYQIRRLDEPLIFHSPGFVLSRLAKDEQEAIKIINTEVMPEYELIKVFHPDEVDLRVGKKLQTANKQITKLLNAKETDAFLEKLMDAVVYEWSTHTSNIR